MTDTLNLVRYESHQRSIDWVREVPDKELKVIFDTVGGNPLAVKLVVGQLSDLGLDSVLEGLTANLSKEGQKMFRHIYARSWELLSSLEQAVLMTLGDVGVSGADWKLIQLMSGLGDSDLREGIRGLSAKSLISIDRSSPKYIYTIHQLTYTFLQNDIFNQL